MSDPVAKLRLDKWLWAARFFKTRSLAKGAIEGGKVQLEGHRVKVSREISVGDRLQIRQGWDLKEVVVEGLSDQRRGAPEAQQLYRETDDSIARREAEAAARKAAGGMIERPETRPTKKQRRQIHRFKNIHEE
ncbi:RNA-binding protein [Parahaliea maris]|uniref:Heat shock protein 15 n=1 Tax=Parahaliea maris TaxID=2716870 RepID=A0A5C9A6T8_9GAMM|nr:S4 domain-containing protein [Parahaliea maris]TXS96683.1 RNA-binding protein [Parahaliea maris]